jgi:UDP-N-acetylmuramoyl-L-alanyl-D-glutamate--2,6-diaminopimelate ligase
VRLSLLAQELAGAGFACERVGRLDPDVCGVTSDSRRVASGDLFIALPGQRTDGGRFIAEALARGAVAAACSSDAAASGAPTLLIAEVGRAAGHLASLVYGNPSRRLRMVGVTGTNGKTSCTYLLESIFHAGAAPSGIIGTVSVRWPGHEEKAAMTTPAATDLQRTLRAMADAGCRFVAMEVSSHALSQRRAAGCEFRAAIFTNLTRDHLDYHGDEESYFAAKATLFLEHLAPDGIAVLNADDPFAMRLARVVPAERVRTFSIERRAEAWAAPIDVACGLDGLHGTIRVGADRIVVDSKLLGAPNLANVLAAAAAARALGLDATTVEVGLRDCAPVPGRLERVAATTPVVLVDYAHTPDALERTLATARDMTRGRLIVVFGCGGDRDKGKRPIMGRAAVTLADVCVLTSDNPRSEDPTAILADIERGIPPQHQRRTTAELGRVGARGYAVEPDRERAIAAALALAGKDDVVVVAGKGHEDYQEIAGVRRPFDDRAVVRRLQTGDHGPMP